MSDETQGSEPTATYPDVPPDRIRKITPFEDVLNKVEREFDESTGFFDRIPPECADPIQGPDPRENHELGLPSFLFGMPVVVVDGPEPTKKRRTRRK